MIGVGEMEVEIGEEVSGSLEASRGEVEVVKVVPDEAGLIEE